MSDFKSKILANCEFLKIHPNYIPEDLQSTERPDIHYKNASVGLEVTRALGQEEALPDSYAKGKLKSPDLLNWLSIRLPHVLEDTSDIADRVSSCIRAKTLLAPGYLKENPWIKRLALAVVIYYPLERYDLETIASNIENDTRKYYSEILFIILGCTWRYDGYEFFPVNSGNPSC
ncbi:MAG: hypothetical protein J6X75_01375 [Clostridia bacterium]|nr:hypothetical protein [Clostridia bacterium]